MIRYASLFSQLVALRSMLKKENINVKAEINDGGVRMEGIPNGKYTKEFREEAIRDIIEIFYNRQQLLARLGYLSPVAFEKQFYTLQKAA